jgi:F-type H+-transporting ATPase subunit a
MMRFEAQRPNIGEMILHHTSDSHEIAFESPFGGHLFAIHLPRFEPVHIGPLTLDLSPTRHVVFMLFAAFLVWLTMWMAGRALSRQRAEGQPPRGLAGVVEAMVMFVRNDVAIANIGHGGARFAPYIMTLFFFILYCNLLGLMPWGATATGNLAVTGGLALTAFLTIEVSGMVALGPGGYMRTIVFAPPGTTGITKLLLTLIMIPVELIGKFVKPFALCLRLFANMTAGHFVILSLLGLIFIFGSGPALVRWGVAGGAVAFVLFMMALELLVAVLQAYIFALLTSVFVGLMQHEH